MNHNITTENIELIKAICINNGITFYDIQVEAIDHIASMVEARWEMFPNEDFESALLAVQPSTDWRIFRYHNFKFVHGTEEHDYFNKYKYTISLVILVALAYSILIYFEIGEGLYNEYIYVTYTFFSFILNAALLGIACWITYKFYKANFYLSFLYKGKYIFGIFFSLFLALALGIQNSVIIESDYHKTVYPLLNNALQNLLPLMTLYLIALKPIIKAQQKYPSLYKS